MKDSSLDRLLKISEAIADLQRILDEYGDVGVWVDSSLHSDDDSPIDATCIKPSFICETGAIQALVL